MMAVSTVRHATKLLRKVLNIVITVKPMTRFKIILPSVKLGGPLTPKIVGRNNHTTQVSYHTGHIPHTTLSLIQRISGTFLFLIL